MDVGFQPVLGTVNSNIGRESIIPCGAMLFERHTIQKTTLVFSTPGRKSIIGGDVMGLQNTLSRVRTH